MTHFSGYSNDSVLFNRLDNEGGDKYNHYSIIAFSIIHNHSLKYVYVYNYGFFFLGDRIKIFTIIVNIYATLFIHTPCYFHCLQSHYTPTNRMLMANPCLQASYLCVSREIQLTQTSFTALF